MQADGSATWDQPGRGRKSMNDGGFIIETRLVVMRCIAGAVSVIPRLKMESGFPIASEVAGNNRIKMGMGC